MHWKDAPILSNMYFHCTINMTTNEGIERREKGTHHQPQDHMSAEACVCVGVVCVCGGCGVCGVCGSVCVYVWCACLCVGDVMSACLHVWYVCAHVGWGV